MNLLLVRYLIAFYKNKKKSHNKLKIQGLILQMYGKKYLRIPISWNCYPIS